MGILHTDPASTAGSIEVLQHGQKYVPKRNGEELELLVSGDGLSVERMLQAQRAMSGGEFPCDRLEYAWPCPQEFHKDILLLTVTINIEIHKMFEGHPSPVQHGAGTTYGPCD